MIDRFGRFTTDMSSIYKNIQKIKRIEMEKIGLKGTHVACINLINEAPDGLTAAQICQLAKEDKAGISRALSELIEMGYIEYLEDESGDKRKYRAKAVLTVKGKEYAARVKDMITEAVVYAGNELSEEKRAIFYEVLGEISQNIEEYANKLEEAK